MGAYAKPPAFAKPLIARRRLGERIGLLVVSVHDWDAGKDVAARSGTARIVVDEVDLPHELDWKCAVALDCLIVGDCDTSVFYATATMLYAAGAASIWAVFPDGVWRLERWVAASFPCGFSAVDGPVPPEQLGRALSVHRDWCLMTRRGVYGTKLFDAPRAALFHQLFGVLAEKASAWISEKRGLTVARAA